MSELTEEILLYLQESGEGSIDSLRFAEIFKTDHQKVVGAVKSLQSAGNLITATQQDIKYWKLTDEGEKVAVNGSYEALVFYAIPPEGIQQQQLMKSIPQSNVGFSKAMSAGWIYIEKKDGTTTAFRKVDNIIDEVQNNLLKVQNSREGELSLQIKQELKKRKLMQEMTIKIYKIEKGPNFTTSQIKQETDLTPEMISSSSWKDLTFKPYNFSALGITPDCGHRHPLMKVRAEFRQIFLEMGFTEMPTNNYIESSFWNFDALFQPQQHPARDAHDTFFVSDPPFAQDFPMEYLEKVKKVHSVGGYGSQGYKYDWTIDEAKKNLLRTHTTAVSARMLYALANQEKFTPAKYFSIDKVFRNETLDATHLAEFHQIEGVVADYGMTLGDLIGTLHQFFSKLGITKLRFKPAYNPYTEPSMEIFSYHEGLKKWVEIGNSGMFRPEMLLPMGIPKDVSVIAWGLSLERPTMIKYKIDNIRELVGHKLNLNMVNSNPICRLEK